MICCEQMKTTLQDYIDTTQYCNRRQCGISLGPASRGIMHCKVRTKLSFHPSPPPFYLPISSLRHKHWATVGSLSISFHFLLRPRSPTGGEDKTNNSSTHYLWRGSFQSMPTHPLPRNAGPYISTNKPSEVQSLREITHTSSYNPREALSFT